MAELPALEAALARVPRDAEAAAAGELGGRLAARATTSSRSAPSDALRDFLLGWWVVMGGAPPERGAAIDALASMHAHGGLSGVLRLPRPRPRRRLERAGRAAGRGARRRAANRDGTAAEIEQSGDAVACASATGERLSARALVLAVPLNCLPAIAASPPLPAAVAEAAGANAGAAVKLLMLARGVQPHGIAVGVGPGLNWLYADEARDGVVLVTGFGWQDDRHPLDGDVSRSSAR